jgi:hypothetical protein
MAIDLAFSAFRVGGAKFDDDQVEDIVVRYGRKLAMTAALWGLTVKVLCALFGDKLSVGCLSAAILTSTLEDCLCFAPPNMRATGGLPVIV